VTTAPELTVTDPTLIDPTLIDPTLIDDLTFSDLLKIALGELPGASQGRWTVHGPVDPGITILELLAWQLEQRLFMAEQVTEPMIRASLRLLGAEEPSPTRVASTVLSFDPTAAPVELPAGTLMNLRGDAASRGFSLDEPVVVLPIERVEVTGRLRDSGDVLEFQLDYGGPSLLDQPVSLLVDVVAAPGVEPAWSVEAADVPPAAELAWTALGKDGAEMAVEVADQTGGFRRSGLVRLKWPSVWNSAGAQSCRLRVRMLGGSYTEAVAIRGVHRNAVGAHHREVRRIDVSDGVAGMPPLPGQRLALPGTQGALLHGAGEVTLHVTEIDGTAHAWTSVPGWTWIGPEHRVMLADRARGELVFGDGRVGRILRVQPGSHAAVDCAIGGGETGNVGPGGAWVRDGGDETATNPVPAQGGREPEAVDVAEQRAAGALASADRAVTASDAEELARSTPGVGIQRAHAIVGLHPGFPCVDVPTSVSVMVVPNALRDEAPTQWTRAPRPDNGLLSAATAHLTGGRLIGQEVFVLPPTYRRVDVWVSISQTSRTALLETRVTEALIRYLDPLQGGTDGQGWPFGGPVRPSALIGVVRAALGPEADVAALSVALDGADATDCADLPIGQRELVCLGEAHVSWVTATPSGSGLV
jgi:hypothetical protein